jgi:hypothetical protein
MPNLEIANLVCRFGDKVLMDYYKEIVLPSFKSKESRKWRGKSYELYGVREMDVMAKNGDGHDVCVKVIAGRLVKNTMLTSSQIMKNGILVKRNKRLHTSPSSFFVLYLDKHKLIYIPEMGFAPTISDFEYCLAYYLKKAHRDYLLSLIEKIKAKNETLRKNEKTKVPKIKDLMAAIPKPSLTITNMSSRSSLNKFIMSYDTLKSVKIELLPVNEEIDGDEIFKAIRESKESINSKKTVITHANTEGLNREKTVSHLSHVAAAGNHSIVTTGTDEKGNKMDGSNTDFKLKRPISPLPNETSPSVALVHPEILKMIESGIVADIF